MTNSRANTRSFLPDATQTSIAARFCLRTVVLTLVLSVLAVCASGQNVLTAQWATGNLSNSNITFLPRLSRLYT
jgi:hypothetical protein